MSKEEEIKQRYERIFGELTKRTRRLFAANEALSLGWGGISAVCRATGLSRQVISAGIQELQGGNRAEEGRVRREGGELLAHQCRWRRQQWFPRTLMEMGVAAVG